MKQMIIKKEKETECEFCFKIVECRPYGKDGKQICYKCMRSSHEFIVEAERRPEIQLGSNKPCNCKIKKDQPFKAKFFSKQPAWYK